jgi:hypothetical protein
MTKKVSKKAIPKPSPLKKTPSKTTSKKSPVTKNEKKSKPSRKPFKRSTKISGAGLSEAEVNRLVAVPLGTNGKKLKRPTSQQVIYGMEEKLPSGKKVIHPITMEAQKYSAKDLKALTNLYRKSAKAQGTKKPLLAFLEVKVPGEFKKTKTGRDQTKVIKAGPLSGKRAKVSKTVLKFTTPKKDDEYRQLLAVGTEIKRAVHRNFQKRNNYEFVKSEMLGDAGFTTFKDAHSRFIAGHEIANAVLKGKTLTEALNKIQVPVSALWLNKNKVVIPKFAKDQVGNIVVTGSVKVTSSGMEENIPINLTVRYLTDIPTTLGRNIRQKLADRGKTFTSPKELAAIAMGAWGKLKKLRQGMKTKKAKNEMRRLLHPGFDSQSAHIGGAIRKIIKGEDTDFPLTKTDNVSVNLQFAFYSDPLATVKKRKQGSKKGTK